MPTPDPEGPASIVVHQRELYAHLDKVLPVYNGLVAIAGIVLTEQRWLLAGMMLGYFAIHIATSEFINRASSQAARWTNGARIVISPLVVGAICYAIGPRTPIWLLGVTGLLVPTIFLRRRLAIIALQAMAVITPLLGLMFAGAPADMLLVVAIALLSIGALLHGIGTFMVRNADALRDSVVELRREVTERREAELRAVGLNEMLIESRDAAQAASHAKSEFLANMSHEIRTPMNAVIGMTGLLLETKLDAEQRSFARVVRDSGDSLLLLLNSLLDFSKIEARQLELELLPFDLRHCVEAALDVVAGAAARKRVELAYLMDDAVPPALRGDATRLGQVLVNLLNNAVKFTDSGEVVLTVTAERSDGGEWHEVEFRVRDTGVGIPEDRVEQIFEAFTQADASTTRRYGGTGLGLAICSRLVALMGGELSVQSEVGEGSTFHFVLPMAAAFLPKTRSMETALPSLQGKRVLIVDDNATNREVLTRQTRAWGMRPHAAESGEAALHLLRDIGGFTVAILDMQMPRMNGLTLAERLRDGAPELPLVMLTSVGGRVPDDHSSLFAAFLTKPIKSSPLHDVLLRILSDDDVESRDDASPSAASVDPLLAQTLPLTILVAEDNPINQRLAKVVLSKMGYDCDVVADGSEVVDSLRRRRYDVVLMDVQMPMMDGLEATRAVRRDVPPPRQPHIIAITASATVQDRRQCFAAGMDDYISKPFRARELMNALQRTSTAASDEPLPPPG